MKRSKLLIYTIALLSLTSCGTAKLGPSGQNMARLSSSSAPPAASAAALPSNSGNIRPTWCLPHAGVNYLKR
ncbi:hypothetical protein ACFOET_18965 [Parapedobacter deserti]|uniref:Uncharacterized protein n=1 Tax=Parapedobacter deserti TaxID=1912957 RepID=A0ABV7JWR5_9SPHI